LVVLIVAGFVAAWIAMAGRLLVATDDVERSDAVLSLSGDPLGLRLERAAQVYAQTGSSLLVVFIDDEGTAAAAQAADEAVSLGVPMSAVRVVGPVGSTADEAGLTATLAQRCDWTSVTVVTSPYHTRRAGWTFDRTLNDDVRVAVTESGENFAAATWWADGSDRGSVLSEWAKGVASLWYVVDPPSARPTDVPC
jgi:uncharacterized SAM-binding protein YcdF (DUF218 family)